MKILNYLPLFIKRSLFKPKMYLLRNFSANPEILSKIQSESDLIESMKEKITKNKILSALYDVTENTIKIGVIHTSGGKLCLIYGYSSYTISKSLHDLKECFAGDHVFFILERLESNEYETAIVLDHVPNFGSSEKIVSGVLHSSSANKHFFIPHSLGNSYYYQFNLKSKDLVAKNSTKSLAFLGKYNPNTKSMDEVSFLGFNDDNEVQTKALYSHAGLGMYIQDSHTTTMKLKTPSKESEESYTNRRNFDDAITFTIDPCNARDADDAISYKQLKNGYHEISVHIADVTNALNFDPELFKRVSYISSTCFLPNGCLPMLPKEISMDKCSFSQGKSTLTLSVTFTFTPTGRISNVWIGRGITTSSYYFSYGLAEKLINMKNEDELETLNQTDLANNPVSENLFKVLRSVHDISQIIHKRRLRDDQSMIFQTPTDSKNIFTGEELVSNFDEIETPNSSSLIEEFMLLANRTVAEKNISVNADSLLRVHIPLYLMDRKKQKNSILKILSSLQKCFKPEHFAAAYMFFVPQLISRSNYRRLSDPGDHSHFFLGFEYYTHFTSPIRRFSDIIVHYQLLNHLYGAKIPQEVLSILPHVSRICNFREFINRGLPTIYNLIILHDYIQKNNITTVEAISTGSSFYIPSLKASVRLADFLKVPTANVPFNSFTIKLVPCYKFGFKSVYGTFVSSNGSVIDKKDYDEILKKLDHLRNYKE